MTPAPSPSPTRDAARGRRLLVLAALLVSLFVGAGCGRSEADDDGPLALRPGASLLDHLASARFDRPAATVGEDVMDALRARPDRLEVRFGPGNWTGGDALSALAPEALDHLGAPRVWRPRRQPELAGGEPRRASLDGRDLERANELAARLGRDLTVWSDPESGTLIIWPQDTRSVLAVSDGFPGALTLHFEVEPEALARLALAPQGGDDRVAGRRRALNSVHRRSLRLDAPGTVRWPLRDLAADTLHLAVALSARSLVAEQGRLVQVLTAGDGAELSVEVAALDQDGVPADAVVAWRRSLAPGEGWVEDAVDLSPWLGRDVELRLVSAPGPAGDAAFDEVLWAGLRLAGETERPPRRPHVVIIDIDTLRADRLSLYGHERRTTPRLDAWHRRWRDRTVVFTDCVAPASWTLPSTLSMLTGLTPTQHGVVHGSHALGESVVTLAERLTDAGYETRGYVEAGMVDGDLGFAQGFDVYASSPHETTGWGATLEWLDARRSEQPLFLFLQTYLVHSPYDHDLRFEPEDAPYTGPYAGRPLSANKVAATARRSGVPLTQADKDHLDRLYDAGIHRIDRIVARFLEELDARFAPEELLVVITSDHGEEFFEHGGTGHGHSLHAELLAVPFIVRFPDGAGLPESGRSRLPVSLLDLVPTVLDVAGLPPAEEVPGRSVRDMLAGRASPRPRVARLGSRSDAIQQDGFKLILPTDDTAPPRLYDLSRDPGEQQDLVDTHPERVDALRDLLRQFQQRHPAVGDVEQADLDASALEAMRELGYLGGDEDG